MENFVLFSKACSILELILSNQNLAKLDILTLVSFDCRALALELSKYLKKGKKNVFVFILPTPTKTFFFFSLLIYLKQQIIPYPKYSLNLCDEYHLLSINDCHKKGKTQIFRKSLPSLETNLMLLFFLFYSQDQKTKQKHQISSSRAKTRSTPSETCVKYRGNIIRIKRNTDVNTSDL